MERRALGWLATALLVLAGCTSQPAPRDEVRWLADRGRVWCYRTLAEPDCFVRPEPHAEARLIAIGPRRSIVPAPAPGEAPASPPSARHAGQAGGPIPLSPPASERP